MPSMFLMQEEQLESLREPASLVACARKNPHPGVKSFPKYWKVGTVKLIVAIWVILSLNMSIGWKLEYNTFHVQ